MPAALETAPPGRQTVSSSSEPVDVTPVSRADPTSGPEPIPDLDPSLNPVIARAYRATTRAAAAMQYSREAPALSKLGYVPASERWEESLYAAMRGGDAGSPRGTLWVTYLAKSITLPSRVCSLCGSELPV